MIGSGCQGGVGQHTQWGEPRAGTKKRGSAARRGGKRTCMPPRVKGTSTTLAEVQCRKKLLSCQFFRHFCCCCAQHTNTRSPRAGHGATTSPHSSSRVLGGNYRCLSQWPRQPPLCNSLMGAELQIAQQIRERYRNANEDGAHGVEHPSVLQPHATAAVPARHLRLSHVGASEESLLG